MMIYALTILLLGLSCPFALGKDPKAWDYLLFAQFWPPSSCIYLEEHHDHCNIPSYIRDWTIHGLWPSIPYSEEPQSCNKSAQFDFDKIKSLSKQMDLYWHYYGTERGAQYLWQHEWLKHGTCAASQADLRGEMNYFNRTLQLHSQVNLTVVLQASGIKPSSSDSYMREDFFNAVVKFYKVKPFIVCVYDKKKHQASIDQIYLCFDKQFKHQDCYANKPPLSTMFQQQTSEPSYYEDCGEGQQIFYLPYNREKAIVNESLLFRSEKSGH